MDTLPTANPEHGPRIEIYTDMLVIQGAIARTGQRTSDLLNRGSFDFLALHDATITPLGQLATTKALDTPLLVRRTNIILVAELQPEQTTGPTVTETGSMVGREVFVRKNMVPCYAISEPYAVYGHCYLHQGTSLENLLQGIDPFAPVTEATIYTINRANVSWQRASVMVNKARLTAMYVMGNQD